MNTTDHSIDQKRKRDLAQIHIAKSQLGMSDDDYRAMLMSRFNVSSASKLDWLGRKSLIDHFKKLGFKVVAKNGTRTLDQSHDSRKVRALWLMLHALGQVRDPSEAALAAYVKRMSKVDALRWSRDTYALIESLKSWSMRHLPAYLDAQMSKFDARTVTPSKAREIRRAWRNLSDARCKGQVAFDHHWALWELIKK